MLTTLKYKIFIDENLNEVEAKNIFKALKKIHNNYNDLTKLKKLNDESIKKICDKKINKNYVLFTGDEELLRIWQVSGGKAFYLDNKKNTCYPDIDRLVITNFPEEESIKIKDNKTIEKDNKTIEVEVIYEFILRCLHIYD